MNQSVIRPADESVSLLIEYFLFRTVFINYFLFWIVFINYYSDYFLE